MPVVPGTKLTDEELSALGDSMYELAEVVVDAALSPRIRPR